MGLSKIKGLHIDGRKEITEHSDVVSYLNPKFVYFPIVSGPTIYKPLVNVGDHVLKGQPILSRTDRFAHKVTSSVSGTVTSVNKKMWHPMGRMVEMVEIENDFEEKTIESWGKELPVVDREHIVQAMIDGGIVGLGGAGFPTFAKYQVAVDLDYVIVNAAECEPYITCDYKMIMTHCEVLLRGIEYAMKASGASHAFIAIKKSHPDAIQVIKETNTNPNISLCILDDVYPAGWEKYIVEKITHKTYSRLPSEVGCVVNNVQTLISLASMVEKGMPLVERLVTFSGEGFENPTNVWVKVGTLISDVIDNVIKYKPEFSAQSYFVVGGPMTGRSIMFDNVVITPAVGSVLTFEKGKEESNNCIGCGKCAENCPAHLTPTEIKEALTSNDTDALGKLCVFNCVQCGLCSYVCPSRVEMTEYMAKAKDAYNKAQALKRK